MKSKPAAISTTEPPSSTPTSTTPSTPRSATQTNKRPPNPSIPPAKSLSRLTTGNISRAISACNRCRSRKTKCDQLFPSCTACTKAKVECVGVDSATGKEIPRSYVSHLEERVAFLEEQLSNVRDGVLPNVLESPSSALSKKRKASELESNSPAEGLEDQTPVTQNSLSVVSPNTNDPVDTTDSVIDKEKRTQFKPDVANLVSSVSLGNMTGNPSQSFLGISSGISFAKLMFAAVKVSSKDHDHLPERIASFRGKLPAPWANKAQNFAGSGTYSDDTDADLPVSAALQTIKPRPPPAPFPDYETGLLLTNVFFNEANPQSPILYKPWFMERLDAVYGWLNANPSKSDVDLPDHLSCNLYFLNMAWAIATAMNIRSQSMPERYHSAAMPHMDAIFSTNNRMDGLKGVLLLALYSIMRPAVPGVWYVLGSCMRMCIDLGLHQESPQVAQKLNPLHLDERRRLFWCAYALDRQVCLYLGRPFGISDDAIRVPLPEDVPEPNSATIGIFQRGPMTIARHLFQLRQLQSEIYTILYLQAELPRRFSTVDDWRKDMEGRLNDWAVSVPKSTTEVGVDFTMTYIDLNWHQTRLLLYGLSPAVPNPDTAGYLVIADAGNRIIKIYRQLHRERKINYTWLSVHNLFMAGTSYLCSLWHCPEVRRRTTVDEIDFNTLACVDVLGSMKERCPAAHGCRNVFLKVASATVQFCNSTNDMLEKGSMESEKRIRTENGWAKSDGLSSPPTPSTRDSIQHVLPTSLANIVNHNPPSLPVQHILSQQIQDLRMPINMQSQPISLMPQNMQSPTNIDGTIGSALLQTQFPTRPTMRIPSDPFGQSPRSQASPVHSLMQSPLSQHSNARTPQTQALFQDFSNPEFNVDHVMRTAVELGNDETYNMFSSGYMGVDNRLDDDVMGGQVFHLMSEVGGGSIWDDQFLFDGNVLPSTTMSSDGSNGNGSGSNNNIGNLMGGNMSGFDGTVSGSGGFGNYVGFSGVY